MPLDEPLMRHARAGKKLGRDSAHRKALYANLTGALIEHGRIKTTVTKAKAVKPIAEKMITLGRRGDLHARRQATSFLRSRDVVHRLFTEIAPKFADRPGGYARIVKLGPRAGDAAEMAYLELVDESVTPKPSRDRSAAATVPTEPVPGEPAGEAPPADDDTAAQEQVAPEPAHDEAAEDATPAAEDAPPADEAKPEAAVDAPPAGGEPPADAPPPRS